MSLEDSAAKALDKITAGADVLTAKLGELATQYGPDVVDAALMVARVEAGQFLIFGVVALVISAVFFPIARRAQKSDPSWNTPKACFFWILTLTPLAASAKHLLDVWNWVGLFEPKLWIARRLLDGVL